MLEYSRASAVVLSCSLCVFTFFIISESHSLRLHLFNSMERSPTPDDTTHHLSVSLQSISASPPALKVAIANQHAKSPVTILRWDTPLEATGKNSGALQIYRVADSRSNTPLGEPVPGPSLKLNRLLPPSRDDLVEILPGNSATGHVILETPWIPRDGDRYRVRFQGRWRGVWAKAKSEVSDEDLEHFGVGLASSYESNVVEVVL